MMKKGDFFKLISARDRIDDIIFDVWSDKQEKAGKEWLIEDFDFYYEYNHSDNTIWVKTPVGDDIIPANAFYEEEDFELRMLWHSGYYDGPMSGMALYNGQKVWFGMEDDRYDNIYHLRTYGVYELSQEELNDEEYWHQRFRDEVGHHTDYGEQYACFEGMENKSKFDKFYKDIKRFFKKPKDYTKNNCLGVFNEHLFAREPRKLLNNS